MDSLCKRPMADMDKLRTKAAKFMQMEELGELCNTTKVNFLVEKRPYDKERSSQPYYT